MNKTLSALVFAMLVFSTFYSTAQCLLLPTSIDQRINESNIIVEGKIIGTNTFRGEKVNLIYTNYKIEIYKIFKGDISSSTIELVGEGGVLGNEMTVVTPSFEGQIGQTGIFMMRNYQGDLIDNTRSTLLLGVAANASSIIYHPDLKKAKDIFGEKFKNLDQLYTRISKITHQNKFVKRLPIYSQKDPEFIPGITNISPLTVTAGTETLITITGTAFGATVRGLVYFGDADNGGGGFIPAKDYHVQSWSDTEIQIWVPSGAGTGKIYVRDTLAGESSPLSAQTLTVTYNISNLTSGGIDYRAHLIDDDCDGDGGYQLLYSTSTANGGVNFVTEGSGVVMDAFERALETWQGNGFSAYASSANCGTTTVQNPSDDGNNIIAFDNNVNALPGSVIGTGYSTYWRCGPSQWELTDIDIIFKRTGTGVDWNYAFISPVPSGKTDFETVALHELGHLHQLGHVIDNGAVMHWQILTGTSNRTLGTEDQAAGNYVELNSVNYNPPIAGCSTSSYDFTCARQYLVYNSSNDCAFGPVPIELSFFNAKLANQTVDLNWQTATEINNDYFILEHSTDGVSYEVLTTINGHGNTADLKDYQYIHANPSIGTNYYRLSQTDFDGTMEYVGLEVVNLKSDAFVLAIAPNPVRQDVLNLNYASPSELNIEIEVIDMTGRVLLQDVFIANEGQSQFNLPLNHLSYGVYFLRTKQAQNIQTIRFVKTE